MNKEHHTKDKIIGKQVIDPDAMVIGTVKDLSFDLASKEIALHISTKIGTEVNVDIENIKNVGDVILLKKKVEIPKPPEKTVEQKPPSKTDLSKTPGLCQECSYQNEPTSKFCIKCGSKL